MHDLFCFSLPVRPWIKNSFDIKVFTFGFLLDNRVYDMGVNYLLFYKEWRIKLSNKIKPYWSLGNPNYILMMHALEKKYGFMEKVHLRTRTLYLLDFVLFFINLRVYVGTSIQQNKVLLHVCYRFISSISFAHQKLFLNLTISDFSF